MKTPIKGLLVSVCVVVFMFSFAGAAPTSDYEKQFYKGNDYLDKGQYDLAISAYTQAIKLNPKSYESYANRGEACFAKGKYKPAIADFTTAIKLHPHETVYERRGIAFLKTKQYDRALADFSRVIQMNPKSGRAYGFRGSVYGIKGKYDMAIADFSKAIELNPKDVDSLTYRGLTYYRTGKYKKAISDFKQAIKIKPDYFKPAYSLARCYAKLKDTAQSCLWLQKSIENGFKDLEFIKKDKDLDSIRESECYKKVLSGK